MQILNISIEIKNTRTKSELVHISRVGDFAKRLGVY